MTANWRIHRHEVAQSPSRLPNLARQPAVGVVAVAGLSGLGVGHAGRVSG
jgi:hypothetical protein